MHDIIVRFISIIVTSGVDPGGQGPLLKRGSSVITPLPAPRIPFAPCVPQGHGISRP